MESNTDVAQPHGDQPSASTALSTERYNSPSPSSPIASTADLNLLTTKLSSVDALDFILDHLKLGNMSPASDVSFYEAAEDIVDGQHGAPLLPSTPYQFTPSLLSGFQPQKPAANESLPVLVDDEDISSIENTMSPYSDYEADQGRSSKRLKMTADTEMSLDSTQPMSCTALSRLSYYTETDSVAQVNGFCSIDQEEMEGFKTTPIFTSTVATYLEAESRKINDSGPPFTQYGLLGFRSKESVPITGRNAAVKRERTEVDSDMIFANMNIPWSAFICGSQGAGKSHTLSCLLENSLVDNDRINALPNSLAAMVFHYDNYTNASCSQICEAAYLCSSGIPVTVLVSPSNIWAMTQLYSNLPDLPPGSPTPKVLPLYLSEDMLTASTMLKLMAVDPHADAVPLYMETVMSILREMAMEGTKFSYVEFRRRIQAVDWVKGQMTPLNLRLQLLDSFLRPNQFTRSTRPAPAEEDIWSFAPGTLTVIDLSDPFVNSSDACSLFSICLGLFLEKRAECGRVIALDEAHKFLLQSGAAKALTAELTSIIRQQRHTGSRILIATQEPTLSPDLIDLSNVTIVHRFLSPAWYKVLNQHLAGAHKNDSTGGNASLFETIVALETGEALLFCPTALTSARRSLNNVPKVTKLSNGFLKIKIRKRVTADGGRSIVASHNNNPPQTLDQPIIPMHIVIKPPSTASKLKDKGKGKDSGYCSPEVPLNVQPGNNPHSMGAPLSDPLVIHDKAVAGSTKQRVPRGQAHILSWKKRVEIETMAQMRKLIANKEWSASGIISMAGLVAAVENALNLEANQLTPQENPSLRKSLAGVAKNAVDNYLVKHGLQVNGLRKVE